jgi:glycosyltransferase involved in cell wall biosynthesis
VQTSGVERPLRVAFEVSTLDRGGLESVVARLALGLRERGVVPLVVCTRMGGRDADRLAAADVEVLVLTGSAVERERQYERALTERGIDVLNTHSSDVGVPIAARLGIPSVVTLHNAYTWLGSSPLDEFRRIDSGVAGYVAVSQSVADFTARRFAIDPARIAVIRNGTELRPFEERATARAALGIPDERVLLVQVGRIDPIKSQLALVAAMRTLAPDRPELLAWVVGDVGNASYALRVQRSIERDGLAGRVVLMGERDDVPRILAAADVFVMPSAIEGLSLAAVEAMSAGLPVVATLTGDADWLLGETQQAGEGLPGALIDGPAFAPHVDGDALNRAIECDDPAHAPRLAEAVAAVLADLTRMRERARVRAAELAPLLSLDRQLDAHAELFAAVAAGGGADSLRALQRIARADARRTADARERASALARAVVPLANAQLDELDLLRKSAAIDRSLAAAEIDAEAALDHATRALDKLRISQRVRAALRDLTRRLPGRPVE